MGFPYILSGGGIYIVWSTHHHVIVRIDKINPTLVNVRRVL
jgi:uncharacterized membrane protein